MQFLLCRLSYENLFLEFVLKEEWRYNLLYLFPLRSIMGQRDLDLLLQPVVLLLLVVTILLQYHLRLENDLIERVLFPLLDS